MLFRIYLKGDSMDKYHKILKKYYKEKEEKDKVKSKKILKKVNNFLIRLFISSFILLLMVLVNVHFKFNPTFLNDSINLTKLFGNVMSFFNDEIIDISTASYNNFEYHEYVNNTNVFKSTTSNYVQNTKAGTIVLIKKVNQKYLIKIQTFDNYIYEYSNLDEINCYLYEYISRDKIIGTATNDKNNFTYNLRISDGEQFYEY